MLIDDLIYMPGIPANAIFVIRTHDYYAASAGTMALPGYRVLKQLKKDLSQTFPECSFSVFLGLK